MKLMTSDVWQSLFLYLLHDRTQVLITFQHYRVTQRLVVHIQCWKQDQKYKTKTDAWFPPFRCRSAVAVSPLPL